MAKSKKIKPGLGKGLGALIPSVEYRDKGFRPAESEQNPEDNVGGLIETSKIKRNPYQPRKKFDSQALEDLKNSILKHGVCQPITVRRSIDGYELIAGERRLRATALAGLDKIPAYILDVDGDRQMLELALVENLQREDLNPIDTANGFNRLIEECDLRQDEIADIVGKDRSTITNFLRLLKLPEPIQDSLRTGEIKVGHARALLGLSDKENMLLAWREIVQKGLSARASEQLVKDVESGKIRLVEGADGTVRRMSGKSSKTPLPPEIQVVLEDTEDKLRHIFGTDVKINTKEKERGSITFEYYSKEDLERLMELFSAANEKNR